jgi:hypothetical protein
MSFLANIFVAALSCLSSLVVASLELQLLVLSVIGWVEELPS